MTTLDSAERQEGDVRSAAGDAANRMPIQRPTSTMSVTNQLITRHGFIRRARIRFRKWLSAASSFGLRPETTDSSALSTRGRRSFSRDEPFSVIAQKTCRRSAPLVRAARPCRSSRSIRRVTPGARSSSRSATSSVGRPSAPASARIRSTLYCWNVMPRASRSRSTTLRISSAMASSDLTAVWCRESEVRGGASGVVIQHILYINGRLVKYWHRPRGADGLGACRTRCSSQRFGPLRARSLASLGMTCRRDDMQSE